MYKESAHHPDLGNGLYLNPVFDCDMPDPAVFREGDSFYLTCSTARYYPALSIYTSKDLVNWRLLCHPFPNCRVNVWAPDLLKYQGRYYLYFTADGTNMVSWSDRIEGGWSEPIDLHVGRIDPGHCAMDGKRYLFLSGNCLQPLTGDGLATDGEMQMVCPPQPLPDEWDVEGIYPESPKVFERGGWFYLLYADGGTGGPATAHCAMAARAKSLFGPWEMSPYNPVVRTWSRGERWCAKGHGHMVEDVDGQWWMLYHAYENGYMNQGRKLLLEPVTFTEDGWFQLLGGAGCDVPHKKPRGERIAQTDALSDQFTGPLQGSWKLYDLPGWERLNSGGGALTLRAAPGGPGESGPLVVAPGDKAYFVETEIQSASPGCEAGVILLYDKQHFSALGWKNGELTLYRLGKVQLRIPARGNALRIRLRNDRNYAAFFWALDAGPLQKLNYVHNVESMNAAAYGGFNCLRAGVYAAGEGEARFGPFKYQSL